MTANFSNRSSRPRNPKTASSRLSDENLQAQSAREGISAGPGVSAGQSFSAGPGATAGPGVPADENPEPHTPQTTGPQFEPGVYPGFVPSFFPYTQLPNLTWQPRVDIFEDHDNILVVVEVPGVNPEQLNVENVSNLLLISGQNLPAAGSGGNMVARYQERTYGSFSREIPLPPHADCDQAQANCKHGLLEIRIPKRRASSGQPASQRQASGQPASQRQASGRPSGARARHEH
jgi:HSP20 family protein